MGFKLTYFTKFYYLIINTMLVAIILDHPEFFSVLVNYLTIKEIIINSIIDNIYYNKHIFNLNILTILYIFFNIYFSLIILIKKYALNFQLIILNSIYNYKCYLKLLIKGTDYTSIVTTFTKLNLKNLFIMSAILIYLLYLLNLSELVIWEHFYYFFIKSNIFNNLYDLFYLKYEFVNNYNIISISLMFILLTIILHGTIGLYMFFFDYLKQSSYILWSLLIYLILIFIFLSITLNDILFFNFLDILPIHFLRTNVFHI